MSLAKEWIGMSDGGPACTVLESSRLQTAFVEQQPAGVNGAR